MLSPSLKEWHTPFIATSFHESLMLTDAEILPSSHKVERIIVWLHGYGADGHDLISCVDTWALSLPSTLFLFPHAPEPCEVNPLGRQWFSLPDISDTSIRSGLDTARPILKQYIYSKLDSFHLSPQDCFVAGFSQGGMLAMDMIFEIPNIAGIISYSGVFCVPSIPPNKDVAQTPILMIHGTRDTVVPYRSLKPSLKGLKELGANVEAYTCLGLGHGISDEGLKEGLRFVKQAWNLA